MTQKPVFERMPEGGIHRGYVPWVVSEINSIEEAIAKEEQRCPLLNTPVEVCYFIGHTAASRLGYFAGHNKKNLILVTLNLGGGLNRYLAEMGRRERERYEKELIPKRDITIFRVLGNPEYYSIKK